MALEKIGPYEFKGVLGRGGMGSVFRAVHKDTGEIHAVKVLAPNYANDDHFRGRFEAEIESLLKLNHRNIVRILSFGQEDGMLFFSMELVEGNSLFQMQKSGYRFDWRAVLQIVKDISAGLRHAHDRGIIHRDLKPGNLLMTYDENSQPDFVKITDFGIAKRFGSSQNTGQNVLGTMDFMSPEQAKGAVVTIRSDLYSLGSVMYALLSGKPPFRTNSVEGSLSNLLRAPAPSISASLPEVPPEIDLLIRRLMAKPPEDRIPTSLALFHQIEEIESTLREGSEARTAHRPESKGHIDTFDVRIPATRENTRRADSKKATGKVSVVNSDLQTVEFTDHKNLQIESTPIREDYFETVTEKTREKPYVADFEPRENKGTWRLLFAFVFVVAIGIYGVWQAYKPPSAEKLYAAIEQGANKPDAVLLEIGQFLEIYPDEERVEQVLELRRVGDAIRLYKSRRNVLTAKGGQRLTDIEKRFLRIVDDSDENPIKAKKEMDIFVDFLSGVELEPRDQECFEAAVAYRIKIKHDAISELRGNLNRIRSVLDIALQTTDVDEQIRLYKSIVSYSKDIDWGRFPDSRQGSDMVQKAQRMLLQLESTHPESFEQLQDENN